MRQILFITALIGMVFLSGCKTTEENYRAAYQQAKAKADQKAPVEGTIYEQMRREAVGSRLDCGDVSLPMKTELVSTVEGFSSPDSVKRLNVVINAFKQVFNAKSQVKRLRESGFPGALLLQTAEPLYYVVAASVDNPDEAAAVVTRLKADGVAVRDPYPIVVHPSRMPVK